MISIVIPTLKEENYIRKTVKRIKSLKFKKGVEIIIVDNSPNDLTCKAIKDLGVKIFTDPICRVGRTRWIGCQKAEGEIIASLDADAWIDQEWVDEVERLYRQKAVAITGPYYYYDSSSILEKIFEKLIIPGDLLKAILFYHHFHLRGGNFAVKRSAYFQAGEFDKNRAFGEDTDLSLRLKKVGRIIYSLKMKPGYSARRLKKQGLLGYFWEYSLNFFCAVFKIRRKNYKLSVVR
ncbi:glycosyltransferase [Candidatus Microgenomates bacterium]|nr:glycosyltransferase [Candidatus Microgenomates bacterium]